mmetsp:Transcript_21659/g.42535  ORF Transcript_21659/g.42535 Transcript_21659/m.42535 type:complete len:692 (+) Transcript_21659:106-2181(+)
MADFPQAQTVEHNGEISCSVEETNRIRKLLGLKPLRNFGVEGQDAAKRSLKRDSLPSNDSATSHEKLHEGELIKAVVSESNGEISCTIEETNRVRIALGLTPLRVAPPNEMKHRAQSSRERAAAQKAAADHEDLQNRIAYAHKQRMLRAKLEGSTLGDETARDGESAAEWLARSTALLSKNDVDKTVAPKKKSQRMQVAEENFEGVRVSHDVSELSAQGEDVVLTLKDSRLIDETTGQLADDFDELEDHRLAARKRVAAAHEKIRRKNKEPTLSGVENQDSDILSKYDDADIDEGRGKRYTLREVPKTSGVTLQKNGELKGGKIESNITPKPSLDDAVAERLREVKEQQAGFSVFQQMQDYYTTEEYEELQLKPKKDRKSKKDKKKKKHKDKKRRSEKNEKSEDDPMDGKDEQGDTIVVRRHGRSSRRIAESDQDYAFPSSVSKSFNFAGSSASSTTDIQRADAIAAQIANDKAASMDMSDEVYDANTDGLVLSSATEFAARIEARGESKHLDAVKISAGQKRSRDEAQMDSLESTDALNKPERTLPRAHNILGDEAFDYGQVDQDGKGNSRGGLTAALGKLRARGDLDPSKLTNNIIIGRANDAQPIIDDGIGPKLEYRDEQGRLLTQKEAFRQINQAFHGQTPSFRKQAKRQREIDRQVRMLKAAESQMSTEALRKHQESTGQAYLKLE